MSDEPKPGAEPADAPDPFEGPDWRGSATSRWRARASSGGAGRVKISRRKKQVLRRRRRWGLAFVLLGGLVVVLGAYLVITGLLARSELNQVRGGIASLQAQVADGNLPAARKTATRIAAHAGRARSLTSGPVWQLAADVPGGGEPLQTVRGVAAAVDDLGTGVLPNLVDATEKLDPATLRRPDGAINLEPIAALAPDLARQDAAVRSAASRLSRLPASTWSATADTARADAVAKLSSLAHTIRSAELAARIAPQMLGQQGTRRYLVAFETEAELRGSGGLPGAFAIVRADHGAVSFERFESDTTLTATSSGLHLGADFDNLYDGADATSDYLDSNVSPNFPYAAQIWTAMWRRHSGQALDGALAVDPTALSYLLAVTGPAELPDGSQVTAANVVSLTEQQVYTKFPSADQTARKAYQLAIAKAVSSRLLTHTGGTTALVKAAGRAATERRLLAWTSDPAVEKNLEQTSLAGVVPETTTPYTGLAINNAGGNKLDYYLHVAMTWQRAGCADSRDIVVTIKATNDAPAGLPAYVTGTTGKRGYPARPGDNVLLVGLYASAGANFTSVELDGRPFTSSTGVERGHPVFTMTVPLPRAQEQTLVVHLTEPPHRGALDVLRQPMVRPMDFTLRTVKCS